MLQTNSCPCTKQIVPSKYYAMVRGEKRKVSDLDGSRELCIREKVFDTNFDTRNNQGYHFKYAPSTHPYWSDKEPYNHFHRTKVNDKRTNEWMKGNERAQSMGYIFENNRVKIKGIPYPGSLRQGSFYTYPDSHTNVKIDFLDHHYTYANALSISIPEVPPVLHLGHEIDHKPHHIQHYDCYKIFQPKDTNEIFHH